MPNDCINVKDCTVRDDFCGSNDEPTWPGHRPGFACSDFSVDDNSKADEPAGYTPATAYYVTPAGREYLERVALLRAATERMP